MLVFELCNSINLTAADKNIGLQLYSLREEIKELGVEKVLEEVSQIGYSSIELADYRDGQFYGMSPLEFKELANRNNLIIKGSHVVRFLSDQPQQDIAYWTEAIKFHSQIGIEYMVSSTLPWWGKKNYTLADVQRVCDYFNEIGRIASKHNVRFGFHNHAHVFNIMVEGKSLWERLMEGLDPQYVFIELDVFWVNNAGLSPEKTIKKYKNRIPILHIKDDNVIGESDKLNFKTIFKNAYRKNGLECFFVEIEHYKNSPLEDAQESYDYLYNAKFVK